MSSPGADIAIWLLLAGAAVFGGVGIMGLLIFPDTRSRMFTAFRGTAIALGAVSLAIIIYASTFLAETSDPVYMGLIFRTLFLAFINGAGMWAMYGIIRQRTGRMPVTAERQDPSEKPEKTG